MGILQKKNKRYSFPFEQENLKKKMFVFKSLSLLKVKIQKMKPYIFLQNLKGNIFHKLLL